MQLLISLAFFVFVVFTFSSCKKPVADSNPNFSITELLTSGPWEITHFTDGTNDRSSNFSGYTFTFLSSGKIYAANTTETITGTWTNENSVTLLNISISGNAPLPYLNKNWIVSSTANSSVILLDDNSGSVSEIHLVKK